MLVWLVRGLFFAAPGYLMLQAAALFLVGTLAAPLWSSHQYTRIRLRMFEMGLVALTVARLGAYSYLVVTDRLAAGTTLLALAEVYNATMALSGLIVIYGVLIPQHLAAHRASSKFDGYGAGSRTRRTSDL
jgi:allantoicase